MVKKVGSLELVGRVVSDKMMKTANVEVTRLRTHRLYNKHMRTHKKFKVRHFHVWLLQADKSPRNRLHALTLIPPPKTRRTTRRKPHVLAMMCASRNAHP